MIDPGVKSLKMIVVEFLRFVSLTSNQNAKKEARDFIKDVYQFIDKCGGVSDEQRKVLKMQLLQCSHWVPVTVTSTTSP